MSREVPGGWPRSRATCRPCGGGGVGPASSHHRGFVPDVPGTGTTLLAAPPGVPLDPRFGPGSAAAHAASGAIRLEGDWPSLRQDVDTPADLVAAARLGLGPRSAARAGGSLARLAGLARRAGTA
jgi:2-phospho-L-lactate guanylyltransferase